MRKSKTESSRPKNSERFSFTHFNIQRLFTSTKQFVDGSDWQHRLVLSVKMEPGRWKHVTRLDEAGTLFPKGYPREANDQPTRAAPILLTRDEQTRANAVKTASIGTQLETIVVSRDWRRIEAWRQRVAWDFGRWPSSNTLWNREEGKRRMRDYQGWGRSSPEPVRKDVQGTESKNEELGLTKTILS